MTDKEKKLEIEKDIKDREDLINKYKAKGYFLKSEREDAIRNIKKLRITDQTVAEVTVLKTTPNSVTFDKAPDGMIASELQMQVDILLIELGEYIL